MKSILFFIPLIFALQFHFFAHAGSPELDQTIKENAAAIKFYDRCVKTLENAEKLYNEAETIRDIDPEKYNKDHQLALNAYEKAGKDLIEAERKFEKLIKKFRYAKKIEKVSNTQIEITNTIGNVYFNIGCVYHRRANVLPITPEHELKLLNTSIRNYQFAIDEYRLTQNSQAIEETVPTVKGIQLEIKALEKIIAEIKGSDQSEAEKSLAVPAAVGNPVVIDVSGAADDSVDVDAPAAANPVAAMKTPAPAINSELPVAGNPGTPVVVNLAVAADISTDSQDDDKSIDNNKSSNVAYMGTLESLPDSVQDAEMTIAPTLAEQDVPVVKSHPETSVLPLPSTSDRNSNVSNSKRVKTAPRRSLKPGFNFDYISIPASEFTPISQSEVDSQIISGTRKRSHKKD